MKYYTYKVTFKDLPGYFYYGSHKNNGKLYFGSPITWACFWSQFDPEVQILQWYATEQEVKAAEDSIIRATWTDKYSLNENVGGRFSEGAASKGGRVSGVSNLTKIPKDILVANGQVNGAATGAANLAKMPKQILVAGGKANAEANLLPNCSANGKASMTPDKASGYGKTTTSQRWQCLVTDRVLNPGNLSKYQRARGIDTSLRKRVG